jgi:type IV pilus assembly protein PilW
MRAPTIARQHGFGLVELMVGMLIGLVVSAVIYQVIATFEGVKRSTTSAAGAQIDAAFSLSAIERDVRAAGWGMPSADIIRCNAYQTYHDDGTAFGPVPGFPQTPVRIIDGGNAAGASDTITVLWASSVRANVADLLLQNVQANPPATPAAELQPTSAVAVSGTNGFAWLTDDSGVCTLVRITNSVANPVAPATVVLSHAPVTGTAAMPNYNATGAYMAGQAWHTNYNQNPRLYDLGALTQRIYRVSGGSLQSQDYFSSSALIDVATNVVALKAQYGVSAAGAQNVTAWVSAVNGAAGNWATPALADFKRIKAVRLAVVVRSPLRERPGAGGVCTTTTTPPVTWPGGPVIDLSNDADWQCYRYRVFETVVPLRNVLWANLA